MDVNLKYFYIGYNFGLWEKFYGSHEVPESKVSLYVIYKSKKQTSYGPSDQQKTQPAL